ncbi:MAG: Gfo/Idh/MocA family oxidoreductase [Caldilineaceae bacterium]
MATIRWGIIGCGDVCEVKSGPGFQKARNSALVAVMRRNGELAADFAQRHNVPRWYDDAQALIGDPEVDAVYVATPPSSHKEYTLLAAAAGKPVYVEKPMAPTYADCVEMVEACQAAGVPLWVGYYRRRLPKFVKMQELLASGVIGDVRSVNIRLRQPVSAQLHRPGSPMDLADLPWRVNPAIAGGGLFLDLAAHMLDIVDMLVSPIRDVSGFASNQGGHYPAEDIVTGSFAFESGALGTGSWFFTAADALDWTEIEGPQGRIGFVCFDTSPIQLTTGDGVQEIPVTQPEHVHQPLIQTIVDELNGVGRCPSTGESAARTTRVMDQMLAGWRMHTS